MAIEWNQVTRTSQVVALILFIGVFALAFWLGMSYEAQAPTKEASSENVVIAAVTYACAADKAIQAVYHDSSVMLSLSDGRDLTLPQTIAASGIRYANEDESFVFWSKGGTAFVTEGTDKGATNTYENCTEAPLPQ